MNFLKNENENINNNNNNDQYYNNPEDFRKRINENNNDSFIPGQSQRTIVQNGPMILNPENFNNENQTKLMETCRTNRISMAHENIKEVIK